MKTYWNYRVMKRIEDHGETYYGIHEVHYEDDKPVLYSEYADITHYGQTLDTDELDIQELRWTLTKMLEALEKPILTERFQKINSVLS